MFGQRGSPPAKKRAKSLGGVVESASNVFFMFFGGVGCCRCIFIFWMGLGRGDAYNMKSLVWFFLMFFWGEGVWVCFLILFSFISIFLQKIVH